MRSGYIIFLLSFIFSMSIAHAQKRGMEITPLGEFSVQQFKLKPNKYLKADKTILGYGWGFYIGNFYQWEGLKLSGGLAFSINQFNSGLNISTQNKYKSSLFKDSLTNRGSVLLKVPNTRFRLELAYGIRHRKVNLGLFAGINGFLGSFKNKNISSKEQLVINTANDIKNDLNKHRLYYCLGLQWDGIFSKKEFVLKPYAFRFSVSKPLDINGSSRYFETGLLYNFTCVMKIYLPDGFSQKKKLQYYKL